MKYLSGILVLFALTSMTIPATATTYVVNPEGTGDYATIAEAIEFSVAGDVIELTDGTFTGNWNRDLSTWGKAITIRSQSGIPEACVIDCQGSEGEPHRGFYLNSGEGLDTVLEGFTVTNGWAGPTSCGGAIDLGYAASPTILNCRFINNHGACAGAIFCHPASPAILDCYFLGNTTGASGRGGAIYVGSESSPTIEGCTFLDNFSPYGGAVACGWDSAPILYRCTLARNTADFGGGGMFCNGNAVVTMTHCTFAANDAPYGGGIMLLENATLSIENTIVAFNTMGDAIHCGDSGSAALACCDIYGNDGGDYVGCIETQLGLDGNFTAIPRFCSPEVDNYMLAANSLCREEAHPLCGTVGAHEVGCGAVNYVFQINPEGTGDFPTIQMAIEHSADGDIVVLADGIYTGEGNRDIFFLGRAITVRSQSGDPTACIIDCQGSPGDDHRGFVFWNEEPPESVLEGVTITNGWVTAPDCGGAMWIMWDSSPTIRNCRFVGNASDYCVGGVFIHWGSPNFYDCVFQDNTTGEWGSTGAVFVGNDCGPGFHGCSFVGNSAPDGGAVLCRFTAIASFNDCLFANNSADDFGGAVFCEDESTPYFNRCTFVANAAPNGSTVYCRDNAVANLLSTIIANSSGGPVVECEGASEIDLSLSVLWENEGGDYVGCIEDQYGYGINRRIDPGFCDLAGGDYTLRANSPCAEENNLWGRIGAFDVGCPALIQEYVLNPNGTGDFPTIQAAIDAALIGDTVSLTDGTYTGDGNRDLEYQGKAITVRSQSEEPGFCIIDCEGAEADPHRGFNFEGKETRDAVLEGIKITNGWVGPSDCGGAIQIRGLSSPTIRNCVMSNNFGTCAGGMFLQSGDPHIADCEFIGNTTEVYGEGGGLYVGHESTSHIKNCTFAYNSAPRGGGVSVRWSAEPTLDHCIFIGNQAWEYGGGAYGRTDTSTLYKNCTFFENSAVLGGGGVGVSDSATVTLENTIIAYNLNGAAVQCEDTSTATLTCCDLYGNAGGDWVGCIAGQDAVPGNISEDPIFCELVNIDLHLHSDSPCAWANNVECGYIGALPVGCGETVDVPPVDPGPSRAYLTSAPNPFNPATVISYGIPSHLGLQPVRIAIYDTAGRLVRTLVNEDQGPGTYSVTWESTNGHGEPVAGGIYFYQFNLGGEKRTRQIVLIR